VLPKGSITLATSQTGSTLYMEPKPVIELNNQAAELADLEDQEELKVLIALTREVGKCSDEIHEGVQATASIDLACARAKHARSASNFMHRGRRDLTRCCHLKAALLDFNKREHFRWLKGVKPTLLQQEAGCPGTLHLPAVRHPLLLQPCLDPLPSIPLPPELDSESSSESDLDIGRWDLRGQEAMLAGRSCRHVHCVWIGLLCCYLKPATRIATWTTQSSIMHTAHVGALTFTMVAGQQGQKLLDLWGALDPLCPVSLHCLHGQQPWT
jgi:hypothetical protein